MRLYILMMHTLTLENPHSSPQGHPGPLFYTLGGETAQGRKQQDKGSARLSGGCHFKDPKAREQVLERESSSLYVRLQVRLCLCWNKVSSRSLDAVQGPDLVYASALL